MTRIPQIAISLSMMLTGIVSAQPATSFFTQADPKYSALVASSEFEKEPEIDYFTAQLPGYGGYELIMQGGDSRSWIEVRYAGQTSNLQSEIMGKVNGQFPAVTNGVVEWRGKIINKVFVPQVIIYRMDGSDPETMKKIESLVVIALNSGGDANLLGVVAGDQPAQAKKLADQNLK